MNYWTELSIAYANQKCYLDDLFQVYPTLPEGMRESNAKIGIIDGIPWIKGKSYY